MTAPTQHYILLVCGFGRCGSSLTMQMLYHGGFPVTGAWPAFEDTRATRAPNSAWLEDLRGTAVKILDPHRYLPEPPPRCRAVWLDRDHKEQAKSMVKIQRDVMGMEVSRRDVSAISKSFDKERGLAIRHLRHKCDDVQVMSFEEMIKHPREAAEKLASFADPHGGLGLNTDEMANSVYRRSTRCLGGLLESALVEVGPRC